MSNKKKNAVLGMAFGTATHRLRKSIMFTLVKELGKNSCYHCGKAILTAATFSIEHREPWLTAADPLKAFFDLDNIGFSHLRCNIGAASQPTKRWNTETERKAVAAEIERQRWQRLSKMDQRQIRREKYLRNGA